MKNLIEYIALRRKWTYNKQDEQWRHQNWVIERGNHGYRLSHPQRHPSVHPNLRQAMRFVSKEINS